MKNSSLFRYNNKNNFSVSTKEQSTGVMKKNEEQRESLLLFILKTIYRYLGIHKPI